MTLPAVSVLMPVYNAELYIKEAIESILNQSFKDFELLIIDDASTDKSVEIIESFHDHRIVLLQKLINSGITDSLNMAIPLSKGKYIARMDADDISFKNRFDLQFHYMENNPDVLVLGAMYKIIGTEITNKNLPITYDQVKPVSLMKTPVAHPTVFIRRNVFDTYNLKYDRSLEPAEDFDLWSRVIEFGKVENLPEVLLHYRVHQEQISSLRKEKQIEMANKVILRQLLKLIDFNNKTYDSDFSVRILSQHHWDVTSDDLIKVDSFLKDIWAANKEKKMYNELFLLEILKEIWIHYIYKLKKYELKNLLSLLRNPIKIKSLGILFNIKFVVKSFLAWETK